MANDLVAPTTTPRFAFIHLLRGLASLLVVWSHLSGFWLLENGLHSAAQDAWYQFVVRPLHIYQNGGHLGVILFFLISGYIITHTSLRETARSFAIRRVLRIFPPLVFAILVAWLMLRVAFATDTRLIGINDGGIWHWLSSLVLLDGFLPDGRVLDVTWTLVIELIFYALTLVFLASSRRRPVASTWVMIGVWAALSVMTSAFGTIIPGTSSAAIVYVGILLVGRVIYLWHSGAFETVDAVLGVALIALIYAVLTESNDPGFFLAPGGWTGIEPVVTYAIALLAFLLLMRLAPARTVQPFTLLGDISYSLYLLHLPVGITVLNLLQSVRVPETVSVVIALVAVVAVSWGAYLLVERPSQALARRLTRRNRPDSTHPSPEPQASRGDTETVT